MKFDSDGKITTIQQSWDQGSLLKQLDVIGKTGRNWPIRDSKEQIKLIAKSSGKPAETSASQTVQRPRENSTSALRDPHMSLHNYGSRDDGNTPAVSPYAGTRPRQRTFEEILGDEPNSDVPEQDSPSKAVAPKIGAGKNFQPSRLFDRPDDAPPEPESPDDIKSPPRYMKPHPKKYNHFEFADGSDPADAPQAGVPFDAIKSKHRQTWDFEDFVTPQKHKPSKSVRHQDARHWGTDENDVDESPAKLVARGKPRRGTNTQIELQDDGEGDVPSQRPGALPRGAMHNSGLGLYSNHLVTDDGSEPVQSPDPRALGNITNLKNRSKHFNPHFDMTDESPHHDDTKVPVPVPEDRKKAVNMMQANWSSYDESPNVRKENSKPVRQIDTDLRENGPNHRIKLGGDGMGNPKGGRGWSLGEDSDDEKPAPVPARKGAAKKAASSFWDF